MLNVSVRLSTQDWVEAVNESAFILICNATGGGYVTSFIWTLHGQVVGTNNSFDAQVHYLSDVSYLNVRQGEFPGVYQCSASNRATSTQTSATINIEGL